MCWRAVGGGADYHANTVRPHRERRKTLTGDRGSNDRFGANQLVSANDRKRPISAREGLPRRTLLTTDPYGRKLTLYSSSVLTSVY